jgi:ribosomal protein S18 acetylase RimI-like enzyme
MTLPGPILSFWMTSLDLHAAVRRTPWGAIVTDPRYPLVFEANHASVLQRVPGLTLADIRAELLPALGQAGATHEHIEVMDADDDSPSLHDLLASPGEHDPDVVMVYEDEAATGERRAGGHQPVGLRIEEVVRPDEPFWSLYRQVPNEYGERLPEAILDQMLARARELFLPWETFFAATVDGSIASVASVLTLEGVAYIDNVVTLPPFRGRGIASAVVSRAVSASQRAGAELVFLLAEENGAPQRLYERLGFRVHRRCYGFTRPLPAEGSA